MKKRSPARELRQLTIIWAICYAFCGWLAWGAIEAGKGVKPCFFLFFFLTPLMVFSGYITLRDAWRDVPMAEADQKLILPMGAAMGACYLLYRFVF